MNISCLLNADISGHLAIKQPSPVYVCPSCGRDDMRNEFNLRDHRQSIYCVDPPTFKVLYALVILGCDMAKIDRYMHPFDQTSGMTILRSYTPIGVSHRVRTRSLIFQILNISDEKDLTQVQNAALVRWLSRLPKLSKLADDLDGYFQMDAYPPPWPGGRRRLLEPPPPVHVNNVLPSNKRANNGVKRKFRAIINETDRIERRNQGDSH